MEDIMQMAGNTLPSKNLAFKVVRLIRDPIVGKPMTQLVSAIADGPCAKAYSIGDWSHADSALLKHGLGLAVFATYGQARQFSLQGNYLTEVYLVEVIGIVAKPAGRMFQTAYLDEFLVKAQKVSSLKDVSFPTVVKPEFVPWPEHTVLVQAVKLLELVY